MFFLKMALWLYGKKHRRGIEDIFIGSVKDKKWRSLVSRLRTEILAVMGRKDHTRPRDLYIKLFSSKFDEKTMKYQKAT